MGLFHLYSEGLAFAFFVLVAVFSMLSLSLSLSLMHTRIWPPTHSHLLAAATLAHILQCSCKTHNLLFSRGMKKESEQHPREEEETVERRKKERVCVCVCEREGEGEGERERMRSSECSNHPV